MNVSFFVGASLFRGSTQLCSLNLSIGRLAFLGSVLHRIAVGDHNNLYFNYHITVIKKIQEFAF